jgi:hypothetical protein
MSGIFNVSDRFFEIHDQADPSKRLKIECSGLPANTTRTVAAGDLASVTPDNVVTLTNKTIDADNNTISNLEHGAEVDNPTSGVHGVTGSVVGTSDAQTLTNKTVTDTTNACRATAVGTSGANVVIGSTAPSSGQVLTASDATNASWQTPVSPNQMWQTWVPTLTDEFSVFNSLVVYRAIYAIKYYGSSKTCHVKGSLAFSGTLLTADQNIITLRNLPAAMNTADPTYVVDYEYYDGTTWVEATNSTTSPDNWNDAMGRCTPTGPVDHQSFRIFLRKYHSAVGTNANPHRIHFELEYPTT